MEDLVIAHCDWSTGESGRRMAVAVRAEGRTTVSATDSVGVVSDLVTRLRRRNGSQARLLIGFDFPIGVPSSYAARASIDSFRGFLGDLARGKYPSFFERAETKSQISPSRPFYPKARARGPSAKISRQGLVSLPSMTCCGAANDETAGGMPVSCSGPWEETRSGPRRSMAGRMCSSRCCSPTA